MPKRTTAFELTLPPAPEASTAYQWLYATLRAQILEGRLRPGERLPSSRDIAAQYRLSRGTIVRAFDDLKAEGYVTGNIGSGTYVSKVLPEQWLEVQQASKRVHSKLYKSGKRRVSEFARKIQPFPSYEAHSVGAFRANVPAVDLFPTKLWAQLAGRRMRQLAAKDLSGAHAMGYVPLRRTISHYLGMSRGVTCTPDEIMIVSGVQEGLDLAARVLLNAGDTVAMEDPGYIGATRVFECAGARISAIPVDDEGLLFSAPKLAGARLVYVTPGHQFPLGITMSLRRRLRLLEWARTSGAIIFEDDYDNEFRYSGRPLPALQGLDRHGQVLFAGSFSKVLFPTLRLSYLVIPAELVPYFVAAKSITNRHAPFLEQAVLCDFIENDHFARHLRRMRQIYTERRSVLLESAQERLGGLLGISPIDAGLQTIGWLPKGTREETIVRSAAERGIDLMPLSRFCYRHRIQPGLQIGFAAVEPGKIRRGVRELACVLERQRDGVRTNAGNGHTR